MDLYRPTDPQSSRLFYLTPDQFAYLCELRGVRNPNRTREAIRSMSVTLPDALPPAYMIPKGGDA